MRRLPTLPLLALAVASGCAGVRGGRATLAPFASDGCSLFPDGTPVRPDLWCDCCLRHDLAYWRGGTAAERVVADRALEACVRERTGDAALAALMFHGVRAGGPAVFPTAFRWGYGWPYGRGDRPLTPEEQAQVDDLLRAYLRRNPALGCGGERAGVPGAP